MDSISNRLSTLFSKLKTTDLVKTKNATQSNIEQFCKILNMAVPITTEETASKEVIKFLHRTDRLAFMRYIHIIKKVHLVLLTDGGPISSVLGLKEVISVKWDKQKNEYVVNKLEDKLSSALDVVNNPDVEQGKNHDFAVDPKDRRRGRRGSKLDKEPQKAKARYDKVDFDYIEFISDTADVDPFDTKLHSGRWSEMDDM